MNQPNAVTPPRPIVPFLKIAEDGAAHLVGSKCEECGEVVPGERNWCGRCATRDRMKPVTLQDTGRLHAFTIVMRSYPGTKVPFVSAVVRLDGGGALKGCLVDIAPELSAIKFDMPVKVVYREVDRKDKEGNSYLSYFFAPASGN